MGNRWNTQRRAFWRTVSRSADSMREWGERNVARMRTGRAPQLPNAEGEMESVELSHEPTARRAGGTRVIPRTPEQHSRVDPFRHLGGAKPGTPEAPLGVPEMPMVSEMPVTPELPVVELRIFIP